MKKILVGVMAISIVALLFAGCGNQGLGLSGAQRERCDSLQRKVENNKKSKSEMETYLKSLAPGQREQAATAIAAILAMDKSQQEAEKERAMLGCP